MQTSPNNLPPEDVLGALQRYATKRTRQSLELIHTLCKEQCEAGALDFSVATIGRLSAARGGPSTQAIRNATGEHYRALLKAWANHVDGAARKPAVRPEPGVADDVLAMIADPSVRAVVGSFLAENRKLRAENTLLKSQAQVVIDRRPSSASAPTSQPSVQVLPAMSMLLPLEVDALRHAISEELFAKMGWSVDAKTGRVSKDRHAIFRAGFATAIKKVLNAV
jgi:hypothetical protein